jgi:hypothetical protein
MKSSKPIVALIYDFDGTLSPGNMQEYSFIPAINKDKEAFWMESARLSQENDADSILSYMWLMLQKANAEGLSLKRESFRSFGEKVKLFSGVKEWFGLINSYAQEKGIIIEHYINSSGLTEMIEGTPIAGEFTKIYACSYLYDIDGKAYWPAVAVNYTTKTQFLFKINKGVRSISDNELINEHIPEDERRIPFKHMIYFGDGQTDIPCMKLVKDKGGHSIAVYKPRDAQKLMEAQKLTRDGRVNFICPADYTAGKDIHCIVSAILDKIKAEWELEVIIKRKRK